MPNVGKSTEDPISECDSPAQQLVQGGAPQVQEAHDPGVPDTGRHHQGQQVQQTKLFVSIMVT